MNDVATRVAREILGWQNYLGRWHRADGTATGWRVAKKAEDSPGNGFFRPDRHFAHLKLVIDTTWERYRVKHDFRVTQGDYRCWIVKDGRPLLDARGKHQYEAHIKTAKDPHASNEAACALYLAYWRTNRCAGL